MTIHWVTQLFGDVLSTSTHIKVFIVHARHSRERGNLELFSGTLDPRFRGDDERGFRTLSCVAMCLEAGEVHPWIWRSRP